MKVQYLTVTADQAARRIDNYLLGRFGNLPRTRIYQMLRRGEIRVNKRRVKQGYRLQAGDSIRIPPVRLERNALSHPPPSCLLEQLSDRVIFEDSELIVLNKPAGMVVHSGSGGRFGVIELLRLLRPRDADLQLVHRLDKETSGCLLLARNMHSLKRLHAALRSGQIAKRYQAMLLGRPAEQSIEVDLPLRKNTLVSGEWIVTPDQSGKQALTRFKIERKFRQYTLVRVCIKTGRTHQIRVHSSAMGCPILGDNKYGNRQANKALKKAGLHRMFLHADMLKLPGIYGQREFKAPLPGDLLKFMQQCP